MNDNDTLNSTDRVELLRIDDVCQLTKLSKSTIWNKLNPDSRYYDAHFPRQVNISKKAVAWYKNEIVQWIKHLRHHPID